jgi:hypothetical protein
LWEPTTLSSNSTNTTHTSHTPWKWHSRLRNNMRLVIPVLVCLPLASLSSLFLL